MRPILFTLGSLNFYSYGFFAALGLILAGVVIDYLAKKKKLVTGKHPDYFVVDALLFSFVLGILASRMSYGILYTVINRFEPFTLFGGGFVFLPGLIVGFAALIWWIRRFKAPVIRWLDLASVGLMLGLAISEIGGYMNDGQVVHLGGLLGYGVLTGVAYHLFMLEKKPGRTFAMTLFIYFLFLFFLGFWEYERIQWIGLNLTQWVSLVMMPLIAWLYRRYIVQK